MEKTVIFSFRLVKIRFTRIKRFNILKLNMSLPFKKKQSLSLDELPELLTIEEVSDILRVSKITLKRWGKKGKLSALRINSRGDRRYKKAEIMRFLGMKAEL